MKKHLVEGVVPVLIELKRSLEGLRHWLLGDLLTCIRALLKDHKNEVPPAELGTLAGNQKGHNKKMNFVTQRCVIRESNPGLYRGRVLFYH